MLEATRLAERLLAREALEAPVTGRDAPDAPDALVAGRPGSIDAGRFRRMSLPALICIVASRSPPPA
eukprot:CAMPEP_0180304698 /NCGR_PEP_ID=MMETSP0988-20121125/25948_1 /TAXON_ID=697907 /ORGANISM="non described non described, Strain CCMP2293" /LENGTH=66 /DNA_ID=CAMNT_0022286915 /DNA_START=130 /DNA_END=326 /DNA_ORIENTATION=-